MIRRTKNLLVYRDAQASESEVQHLIQRARANQRRKLAGEVMFWTLVRNKRMGVAFYHQVVFAPFYIADFVAPECKLIIEIDELYHETEEMQQRDKLKDSYFRRKGFEVLRFSEETIVFETSHVKETINAWIPSNKRVLHGV